jgi:hypothetical protein
MRNRSNEPRSSARSPESPNDAERAKLIDELRQDLAAIESYEALHGSFPDLVRRHYKSEDDSELSEPRLD